MKKVFYSAALFCAIPLQGMEQSHGDELSNHTITLAVPTESIENIMRFAHHAPRIEKCLQDKKEIRDERIVELYQCACKFPAAVTILRIVAEKNILLKKAITHSLKPEVLWGGEIFAISTLFRIGHRFGTITDTSWENISTLVNGSTIASALLICLGIYRGYRANEIALDAALAPAKNIKTMLEQDQRIKDWLALHPTVPEGAQ